jgi:hypothetical protein
MGSYDAVFEQKGTGYFFRNDRCSALSSKRKIDTAIDSSIRSVIPSIHHCSNCTTYPGGDSWYRAHRQ